jgi:hypothetical protein
LTGQLHEPGALAIGSFVLDGALFLLLDAALLDDFFVVLVVALLVLFDPE